LLLVLRVVPNWGNSIAARWQPLSNEVSANWGRGFHLGQFIVYLISMAAAGAGALAWALLWRFVLRHGSSSVRLLGAGVVTAAAMLAATWLAPSLLGYVAATLTLFTVLSMPADVPVEGLAPTSSTRNVVLATEAMALAWGGWLMLATRGWAALAVAMIVAILVAAAYFAGRAGGGERMTRAVVAGAPVLLFPLLGFCRRPSAGWLVAALLAGSVLYVTRRGRAPSDRLMTALLVSGLWSVGAVGMIPRNFRDLTSLNSASHEAFHLGWVNSAFHGKLLGADAGTLYGILREYLIVAYGYFCGVTIENVRIAHVLLNLLGLAIFLLAAGTLFKRRPVLLAALCYAAIFYTPLRSFWDFDRYVAFGWADGLRMIGPMAVVIFACSIAGKDVDARTPGRRMFVAGALTALTFFYSQEFGLCAAGAVVLAVPVAYACQRSGRGTRDRIAGAIRSLFLFVAGIAAPVAAVLVLYACFGKARLLVQTTWETLTLSASGAFGSIEFPVGVSALLHPDRLLENRINDPIVEFVLPIAIYVVALCALLVRFATDRWSRRSTVLLGLVALGVAGFRVAMARADVEHLLSTVAPAIICLGILLDDALDVRIEALGIHWPVGRVVAGLLLLGSVTMAEKIGGVGHFFEQIAKGSREASSTRPYEYPDIPRSGDAYVDADFQALARFVRKSTAPTDRMFTLLYMMDGGELYFLCDRVNPTRYDLLAEIMTATQQREVLRSLEADPPRLIVGKDGTVVGADVIAFVNSRWTVSKQIGRYTVWMMPADAP
jgi:hypothetical protein